MTNAMIILNESVKLLEKGVLKGTGEKIKMVIERDGKEVEKELEMPEEIHTYQSWKSKGYQVKHGEKAIAQFPIWKYKVKKAKTEDEEDTSIMFLRLSSFFKFSQVEKIEEE